MTAVKEISELDTVRLAEPFENAPAGATGGVLDVFEDGNAMVEFTSLPESTGVDRVLVVPLSKLRLIRSGGKR